MTGGRRRKEPPLARCGFAARGLWHEMRALMAAATPYGKLMVAGRGLGLSDAATLAGHLGVGTVDEVCALLLELAQHDVFTLDDSGTIRCAEMIAAARRREVARGNGRKGGNPALHKTESAFVYDGPTLFDHVGITVDEHQQDLQQAVVDLSEFDLDPEPDARALVAVTASADSTSAHTSTAAFLDWFVREGIAAGVIGAHFGMMVQDYARRDDGTRYANALLTAYGRPECEVRARRLFETCRERSWRPTLHLLSDRWEICDGKTRAVATAMPTHPQLSESGQRAIKSFNAARNARLARQAAATA